MNRRKLFSGVGAAILSIVMPKVAYADTRVSSMEARDLLLPGLQFLRGRAVGDISVWGNDQLLVVVGRYVAESNNRSYHPGLAVRGISAKAIADGSYKAGFAPMLADMCEELGV